ncbi:hypothetical protein F2Q70_00017547 [Brassica cretica]|uniref:Uncharacterized protein n=1 Tax=Brassica cretica TaxID=69181 RepID=A0A8S9L339_BRACR|nr:hypothetical protein F2Q70_00017547 [Brassica cretica]KAF2599896.1 hypothetical protein F2Q68_00010570 [Brassica cretica]
MSFNVQAALCFPWGEPVSAFSGRHSMTGRLFLNLLCHGGISGYMARKSGSKVVGTLDLELGTWDPEPGSWNPEPRGGRAAVFSVLGQGSFRGTTPMEFDDGCLVCLQYFQELLFWLLQHLEFVKVVNPAGRCCALLEDLLSFSYVAEMCAWMHSWLQGPALQWRPEPAGTKDCKNVIPGWDMEPAGTSRDS